MQINNTFSTYTTSLFQEPKAADPAGQPAASPGPASVFSRGVNTDMNGFYSDPRVTSVGPATLSLGPIAATMMACADMATADRFRQRLGKVEGYLLEGLKLHLQNASGKTLLSFQKTD